MEWEAVRQALQAMVPESYWTALERHENGAWSAYTPGLPVDGGMTIAGSRSDAYFEAQRSIAVTIRNLFEVGQRVPPCESAMSLSDAQAWDSSHREVFEQLDEEFRGGAGNSSSAPKIVERQWQQVHVDLSLADESPLAADRAELRETLRQRGVLNIWASDPESAVDEEEEEGDEEVDADEEDDDEMVLDRGQNDDGLGVDDGLGIDSLGVLASEEALENVFAPQIALAPRTGTHAYRSHPSMVRRLERSSDQGAMSEDDDWQPRRGLAYTAREMRAQNRAAGAERAARPRTQSHLETLAGVLSSEGGEAETRAQILDITGALRGAVGARGEGSQSPRPPMPASWARLQQAQQPGLRALEHMSTAFLQDLRGEEVLLPEAALAAHQAPQPQSTDDDNHFWERLQNLRRAEGVHTTRRHSERQRSFTRLYQAARAGVAQPTGAHRVQTWKAAEAALC